MFSKFSEEAQKILLNAKKEMTNLKHPYVGSEHLLLAILYNKDLDVTIKLNDYNITYKTFKDEIIKVVGRGTLTNDWFLYTPLLKRIIEGATIDCKESKEKEVTPLHLFLSMMEEGDGVAIRILMGMNVDIDALYDEFSNNLIAKKNKSKRKLMIEEYAVDLNKKSINNEIDPVVGRESEINNIIEILSRRTKNNPLLIGDAGVGKTAIVEELANRIVSDLVPEGLKNKRILSVAMASLVAGTKYRGEFEERINKLLKEVEDNDDIILFVDEIHTLVGAGGAEGAIDASNILKPSLARGKLKIIGATTTEEYTKYIEKDKALDRRFQKVRVSEPNKEKTKDILLKLKPLYESFHNTKISEEIIDYIIEVSERYIYNRKFPDKAIDILDEVCARTVLLKSTTESKVEKLKQELKLINKSKKEAIVKEDFDMATEFKLKQNKIETKINKIYLKNNNNSIPKEITKQMVMDVITSKTSIPVFENKKANKKILNLESNLNKKVKGQKEAIKLISDYTVILLDEIEKASNDVIKLFLQILDEGKIKDSKGVEVNFSNTIIFMTSNLGCNSNSMGFNAAKESMINNILNEYFGVEFVNRIDDIVLFNNLDFETVKIIVKDKLTKLKNYYNSRDIKLSFGPKLVEKISNEVNYDTYGARRIDKVIDKNINNYVINEIIKGNSTIALKEGI